MRGFERVPSLLVGAARPGAGTRGGTGTGACSQPAGHVVQGGTQALHMFHQFHAGKRKDVSKETTKNGIRFERRGIILKESNSMSGVFQNIDPPPPPHPPASMYPPPLVRGEDTTAGWRGGGVSIIWKTPEPILYYM
jgi:hypothetical protein